MPDGGWRGGRLAAQLPLFRELGDIKRIRSAGAPGSIAERLFERAWAGLVRGEAAASVMRRTAGAALAAARLGDLDFSALLDLGLSREEAETVLRRAVAEVAGPLDAALVAELADALALGAPAPGAVPDFVHRLARQPRAGVTCPGRPRLLLQPAESHAEHCLMVAVLGALAAADEAGDPAVAFVAGLAHHLHNVFMPDSGFTGEVLLGAALEPAIARARERALAELAPGLADSVRAALAPIGGDATPEARAFHVADVLDRVLEIEQHFRAARATLADVLGPYALVHDGPVKPLHDAILRAAGLA